MALRRARFRPGGRPAQPISGGRPTAWAAALALPIALGLGGCGAVETWRSLSGIDRNDPDPQTALFSGNLAAGEAAPYPNLASVPPPPTHATTTAERQKLTQSLIADRNRAEADAGPALPAPAVAAKPTPHTASPSPGAPAEVPAAAPVPARTASNAPQPGAVQRGTAPSGRRKADEPPEPGPPDSNLEMPQIRSVPEPEATRPPPPAPALAAVPRSPAAAAGAPSLPASVATLMPEPAPPVPVLEPAAPPPAGAGPDPQHKPDAQRRPEPKRAPATTVATLDLPAAATSPGAAPIGPDRAQIERVAGLYRDNPGSVRVIAYAAGPAAGGAGSDPLASYHAALGRAQGVARALAEAGIPAGKIQTEAAPAAGARAPGRVEIQFAP